MTKSTEIVVVEEQHPKEQPTTKNNPFPLLFPNFKFDFQLPFFNQKPKNKAVVADQKKQEEQQDGAKPNVVRFPKTQVVVPPPLETQAESQSSKTSNPVILWQVYALGAFFISRWIWARWNERKAQGRSPNDGEGRPSDDGPRSSENE